MVDLATAISDGSSVNNYEQSVNSTPAAEPSRMDVIREAVASQKDRADPDAASARTAPSAGERARAPDGKFAPDGRSARAGSHGNASAPRRRSKPQCGGSPLRESRLSTPREPAAPRPVGPGFPYLPPLGSNQHERFCSV